MQTPKDLGDYYAQSGERARSPCRVPFRRQINCSTATKVNFISRDFRAGQRVGWLSPLIYRVNTSVSWWDAALPWPGLAAISGDEIMMEDFRRASLAGCSLQGGRAKDRASGGRRAGKLSGQA